MAFTVLLSIIKLKQKGKGFLLFYGLRYKQDDGRRTDRRLPYQRPAGAKNCTFATAGPHVYGAIYRITLQRL